MCVSPYKEWMGWEGQRAQPTRTQGEQPAFDLELVGVDVGLGVAVVLGLLVLGQLVLDAE